MKNKNTVIDSASSAHDNKVQTIEFVLIKYRIDKEFEDYEKIITYLDYHYDLAYDVISVFNTTSDRELAIRAYLEGDMALYFRKYGIAEAKHQEALEILRD